MTEVVSMIAIFKIGFQNLLDSLVHPLAVGDLLSIHFNQVAIHLVSFEVSFRSFGT